jgi:hypothetical protein
MAIDEVKRRDPHGKGGGLLDGKLVREFPSRLQAADRKMA